MFGKKKKEVELTPEQLKEQKIKTYLDMYLPGMVKCNIDHIIQDSKFRAIWAIRAYPTRTADQALLRKLGEHAGVTLHVISNELSTAEEQKIINKAAADRLAAKSKVNWLPEDGALYQIQFAIMKDQAVLYLDTTGTGLFKRGYRPAHVAAPLRETLAAALVDIAGYRGRGDFCDPFCGSGTIAIEAALAAKNRAPGIRRHFSAERWDFLPGAIWDTVREEARAREFAGDYHIFASDIDPKAVTMARENAKRAGVDDCISFSVADAREFSRNTDRGVIVTNPPYGERLMEKREAEALYAAFGRAYRETHGWQLYLLSSHTEFERSFGRTASKKRKLYNGTIKCDLFMYR